MAYREQLEAEGGMPISAGARKEHMNLHNAVMTLRRFSHRGTMDWYSNNETEGADTIVTTLRGIGHKLTEFEAIAIAKALVEQEQKPIAEMHRPYGVVCQEQLEKLEHKVGVSANVNITQNKRLCSLETSASLTQKYAENIEERVEKLERHTNNHDGNIGCIMRRLDLLDMNTVSHSGLQEFDGRIKGTLESLVREILKDAVVVIAGDK